VGCKSVVADSGGEFLDDVPNQLLGHSLAPGLARATHFSEELSCVNACGYHPFAEGAVDPVGHWDRSDVAALTNEIDDRPMIFALLQVIDR